MYVIQQARVDNQLKDIFPRIWITLILIFFTISVYGQGFSVSRYYAPEEYGGFQQVWETVQDTNQYLYFGDGIGMVIFDGVNWQTHHIGSDGRARSFFRDSRDQVYLSGQFDFGIVDRDSLNRYRLRSISPGNRSVYEQIYNEHLKTFQIGDSVVFYGANGLDIWDGDSLRQYPFKNGQTIAFTLHNRIFVSSDAGIHEFKDEAFLPVSGSEQFAGDRLNAAVSLRDGEVILGFGRAGLVSFDGFDFRSFNSSFNDAYAKGFVYDINILNDSLLAIALANEGLVITDYYGEIKEDYTKGNGFSYQGLLGLYTDHESNLWLNLWGGIEKLLTGVPLRVFTQKEGIGEELYGIRKLSDKVYVWGTGKLFSAGFDEHQRAVRFNEQMTELPGSVSDFHSAGGRMYLISGSDLYEVANEELRLIKKGNMIRFIDDMTGQDRLLIFGKDGIHQFNGQEWQQIPIKHELSLVFNSYHDGKHWFINTRRAVYLVDGDSLAEIPFENSNSQPVSVNMLGLIDGELFAGIHGSGSNNGLFRYDEQNGMFRKDAEPWQDDPELTTTQVLSFKQCSNGDVWFYNNGRVKRAQKKTKDTWTITDTPYQLIGDNDAIYTIECMDGGEVWFGGNKALFQLTDPDWVYDTTFRSNVTGIFVRSDSLIYGGFGEPVNDILLPYKDNELRFTYAATSYMDETQNTYSVKLDGFDKDWSEWTSETQKDYTNIPEGDYVFRVKSRNVFDSEGIIDSVSFSILPPWYRTWWAYLIYLAVTIAVLYSGFRIRLEQLLKVEKMRTRIASDLHDEISATLTGISYFAEAVEKDPDEQRKKRFIGLIQESASDAKEKITDIVWSINPEHDDFTGFLARCRRYASDLLETRDITYKLTIPEEYPGKLPMDYRQHFWLIFKEVLTNAVRHSGATQLNITIRIERGIMSLLVQDNGKGFKPDEKKSGNGVSNIRRRAESMHARVELNSDPEFGTRWHINIPLP